LGGFFSIAKKTGESEPPPKKKKTPGRFAPRFISFKFFLNKKLAKHPEFFYRGKRGGGGGLQKGEKKKYSPPNFFNLD